MVAAIAGAARVIYAKLTSTGAYDVVAKTSNIELASARELAEQVQLGNLPFGVKIGEELGYARLAAGGHVIARYTTYGWNDGRPAPPMTDLIRVDDATFDKVRRNPFVLVPHSDAVFAELTELPPVLVPAASVESELARVRALAPDATEFTTFVAGVLVAEALLVITSQSQVANLELLMLLLPPRLRDRLTFQTSAHQPPQLRRRVTVADVIHASLRQAGWARVLPDEADTLPLNPAQRFTEFLGAPERLQRAHVLYEKLAPAELSSALAAEATRLVRIADFLSLLDGKLITEALRLVGKSSDSEATLELAEMAARFPASAIAEAAVAIFESGSDEPALVKLLAAARGPALTLFHEALCTAVLAGRRAPSVELGALLLRQAAAEGDTDRAIRLHAALPAGTNEGSPPVDVPGPAGRYFVALAASSRSRALGDVTALVQAAAGLYDQLRAREARTQLEQRCASAVDDALHDVTLNVSDVRALQTLRLTLDGIVHDWSARFAGLVLTDGHLRRITAKQLKTEAERIARDRTPEYTGALCAALLVGITESSDGELRNRLASAAQAMLAAQPEPRLGVRIAALLEPLGIRDNDLLEQRAFAAVLPLMGDTAREASLAQSIGGALVRLYTEGPAGAGDLAAAVLSARASDQTITVGSRAFATIISALRNARERGNVAQHAVQTELALDLLAFAAEPAAFSEMESTALGKNEAVGIRLRRLDRAITQATTAQDEQLYSALADALDGDAGDIDDAARKRLRNALGTTGMHRRILDAFNSVVQRS